MNHKLTGFAAVALIMAATTTIHAWTINSRIGDNRQIDNANRQRVGGNAYQDSYNTNHSNNQSTTHRNDNRSWVDSRNMSDNRQDHQRHQSHNLGDNSVMINGAYQSQVGHKGVGVVGLQGSNNLIDNSISGNFGLGHTIVK